MKKTFKLDHPKIKVPRVVDSVKHEIKKYLKRERNKTLPEDAKYWGFDCKIGQSEETAVVVPQSSLTKKFDELVANNIMTIYVEIIAVPMEFIEAPEAIEEDETIGVFTNEIDANEADETTPTKED